MYNEAIRKNEAYHGSLLYERKEGIKEGIKQGIEKGIEQGQILALTKMVRNDYLTKELAAEGLGISVKEFEKYL